MASPETLKARLPRGLVDRGPEEIKATEKMLAKIRAQYELYGFEPVETPLIEYTDALGKFLPDQDRPNEGVFSFQDDDEQWLSLRYDLTAPLARFAAESWDKLAKPYRSYRNGWVFRNEKPGPGRFRQFMQFDADIVGSASVAADAEICMLMADTLEALGLKRGQYVVKVNNRKVLDGVMEAIGLGAPEDAGKRLTVLRAIDKLDRLGIDGVRLLLGEGRKDDSGDFTKGAGLSDEQIARVLALFEMDARVEAVRDHNPVLAEGAKVGVFSGAAHETMRARGIIAGLTDNLQGSARGLEGAAELKEIWQLVSAGAYNDGRIRIDPSVVRGLEYYTGPVYEAELTFEVPNDDGQIVRFGSVGGGGRYDGLVSRFLPEPVPATGFSIGVSRLMAALKAIKSPILGLGETHGPVVVLVMDKAETAAYQALVTALRHGGIAAEMYLGASGMKAQMKYADRRKAPCVVIQGSNERENGVVQLKDLVEGARLSAGITDNKEWRESRPAQVTVPVSAMVGAVADILARYRTE
ncbi:MAG: histidine--tRNA ligase [Ancalomicrobiaceae bacterium]|nr:histidine--tRNA ligase [Ancalomicrobiaceae bacterium]